KYGLCAAVNPHGQVLDFYCVSGSDIASYASLYGKEQRADLGQIQTAVASPTDKLTMAIIRDGDLFYLIINGEVMQIREFICDATEPGIYVTNATIRYTAIDYTDDASAVDEAIAEYMGKVKGYGIADGYAQLGGIEMIDEGSFTYTDKLMRKGIEQSRIAFAGAYGGDMEISFKTEGLKALATADNSGDAMCRLRFLLYSDNDVINMICLGVANKQDCIETYGHYDIAQWISHGDLTGNASTYFDWGAVNEFRIVLTSTGRTNTFSVYVNGALAAARTVLGSGDVRFGFEAENVSGTVRDFKVSGGEMR
ncbi:MAG: hypothetical protein II370_03255, partial [Clostridia bacterium]|nr:hypothetical protein [Clostridia bacterium]